MNRATEILNTFATPDVIIRRDFFVGKTPATMLFHPDITDAEALRAAIISCESAQITNISLSELLSKIIFISEAEISQDLNEVIYRILSGDAILFLNEIPGVIIINARKWTHRAVAEPPTETVMRGPREGFVEDFKTNLSLIERRLKTEALAIEKLTVGRVSKSSVALVYISTIADSALVNSVRRKIKKIDIDALIDSYYLQPYLEERPLSIFTQVGVAEKPDVVASKLLEGRVALIVDGSPMVLTVPYLLIEDFQSSEDYYERHSFATFLRIMRFASVIFSVLLPGLYVALQVYHFEILPFKLLVTVMNALKGIPFPPIVETLFVLMLFEIIREAAIRMPRSVGTAMSIVGALVLGDTAVKAGIISSPSVMVIALSSIALYTVPNQVGPMTLLRIIFTIIGGLSGLYGLLLGGIFLIFYLCDLSSYGTPYLAPFAPLVTSDLKDSLIKSPQRGILTRPQSIKTSNKTRVKLAKHEVEKK